MARVAGFDIWDPQLLLQGDRYYATWVAGREKGWARLSCEDKFPADGWMALSALVWQSRCGVGLKEGDRDQLASMLVDRAKRDERKNVQKAIERYIYVFANFEGRPADQATQHLLYLDRKGNPDVERLVWKCLEKDPGLLERKRNDYLLHSLDIEPGEAVTEIAAGVTSTVEVITIAVGVVVTVIAAGVMNS